MSGFCGLKILAALEQADERLLAGVRLGEHRGAGLLEDLESGELAALGGDVHIDDAAVCGFEVDGVDLEEIHREVDAAFLCTVLGAKVGEVLNGVLDGDCICGSRGAG